MDNKKIEEFTDLELGMFLDQEIGLVNIHSNNVFVTRQEIAKRNEYNNKGVEEKTPEVNQ